MDVILAANSVASAARARAAFRLSVMPGSSSGGGGGGGGGGGDGGDGDNGGDRGDGGDAEDDGDPGDTWVSFSDSVSRIVSDSAGKSTRESTGVSMGASTGVLASYRPSAASFSSTRGPWRKRMDTWWMPVASARIETA